MERMRKRFDEAQLVELAAAIEFVTIEKPGYMKAALNFFVGP